MSSKTVPVQADPIKSTWRTKDKSTWTPAHWFFEILNVHSTDLNKETPVHQKDDKVPYTPEWHSVRWVIVHSSMPLIIQQLYINYFGRNFTPLQAFVFYSMAFKLIAIHQLQQLRATGHKVGFLDGDVHGRDGVPDIAVTKIVKSLLSTSTFRPLVSVFLAYRTSQAPSQMNWYWLPIEISLYGIILDFWFYWYHRLMHEVNGLWKYHRTHHLTKHPNPLLTLYADLEQEIFDIVGIPFMAYATMRAVGMPMGFYEWWIAHQFVMFAELAGHSGIRIHIPPPNPVTFVLRWFDCELLIEDHDLHHRQGWKKSGNYVQMTADTSIHGTQSDAVWFLMPGSNSGTWRLHTAALGTGLALDVLNDSGMASTKLQMAATGDFSGQYWVLQSSPDDNGSFRLFNNFTGPGMHLDVYADTMEPHLSPGDASGQYWYFTPVLDGMLLPASVAPAGSPAYGSVAETVDERPDKSKLGKVDWKKVAKIGKAAVGVAGAIHASIDDSSSD
ncbi:fatty acid hydroxylase superfamily protein [Sarocladium implicatum]|nr:fatty acid hydroxylase superfamily protein [Sarocladium implicatum]